MGIEVGTITFPGTAQQVADQLQDLAASLGIPTNGTATENLVAILEHVRDDAKRRTRAVRKARKQTASEAQIEAELDQENAL